MNGLHVRQQRERYAGALSLGQIAVDTDDRRMHIHSYDAWVAMLRGRAFPSIEDLEATGVAGPRQVLLDLRADPADPELTCIGGALVGECGARNLRRISEVPHGSLLWLLTAHHPYAYSSRQPIAFEGEHVSLRGHECYYRGILLPLSSNGREIDFVYGSISWREGAECTLVAAIEAEMERAERIFLKRQQTSEDVSGEPFPLIA